jgi:hypothetical protein
MMLDARFLRVEARRSNHAWALCRRCRHFVELLEVYLDWDSRTGERQVLLRALCCGEEQVVQVTEHGVPRAILAMGHTWTGSVDGVVHELDTVFGGVGLTRCQREIWIEYRNCFPPTRLDAATNTIDCVACLGTTERTINDAA